MKKEKIRVDILISNPNHHWQMVRPIVRALQAMQVPVRILSLCEFRRMNTPKDEILSEGVELIALPGFTGLGLKTSSGQQSLGSSNSGKRLAVQKLIWYTYLKPAWKRAMKDGKTRAVLLLNDFAYPNNLITRDLKGRDIPFFLLQEGIRFPLPNEPVGIGTGYGSMGSRILFAWGENSRQYFASLLAEKETLVKVSGSPRFDEIYREPFTVEIEKLKRTYKPGNITLGLFSNPIDDQGFCNTEEKLELLGRFVELAVPIVKSVSGRIWIKLHPREDAVEVEQLIRSKGVQDIVSLVQGNIFGILKAVDASVVLASTVGLESLLMGKPLAVLSLPRHGFVFDYVSKHGAVGLDPGSEDFGKILKNLVQQRQLSPDAKQYLHNSIGNIGCSASTIAEELIANS